MKESNVRYGVVDLRSRIKYEKEFQMPFGYDYTTWHERDAIEYAKKANNQNIIVERVFDTSVAPNNKEEIFRSGKYKERE